MKNLKQIFALIFLIVLMGCDNNRPYSEPMNMGEMRLEDEEQAVNYKNPNEELKQENQIERKFIKNGQIEFETKDLDKTQENF